MASALQTLGQGLLRTTCATAGPSRRAIHQQRWISSTETPLQRQALGRITPKRIAVRLPPGTGGGSLPKQSILRPTLFCLALGGTGYLFAAAYTNEDTRRWSERLGAGSWWRNGKAQPTDREIARAKTLEGAKRAQQTVNDMGKSSFWGPLKTPLMRIYVVGQEYMLNTPPAQLAPMALVGLMGTVFLAWRVKRWEPFMRKWWLHRPVILGGGAVKEWQNSVTLFTSTLSHQSLAHYAFNSFALYSFGAAAYAYLATPPPSEEPKLSSASHTPHFLAFLLVAGLASSLSSHLWTNIVRLPKLIRTLSSPARISSAQALAAHQAILPSLGASGAIYAALTVTACAYPESHVGIIFVPFISFPIGLGVAGMVGMDLLGLIRGWRMFDHVAHLSGAAFGFLYYQYGRQIWVRVRRSLYRDPSQA